MEEGPLRAAQLRRITILPQMSLFVDESCVIFCMASTARGDWADNESDRSHSQVSELRLSLYQGQPQQRIEQFPPV
jgi:hypothetical protein